MTSPLAADATENLEVLRRDESSASRWIRDCLSRIERMDGRIHAFLHVDAGAEMAAADCDRRRRDGEARRLEGLPIAVKDNITVGGLPTTCGSRILGGWVPSRDATAVARLRAHGAVILGKTNLDEFAMGSSTENSAFGPTRNPWNLGLVPGGSSGGSAAAVAAGMCAAALGSDTGGSVRQPAAFCGVVGMCPSHGRVSRSGLVAFASSLDQIGPMARSVRDAALILEVIAGPDPLDSTSAREPAAGFVEACGRGVARLRVGLPREFLGPGVDPEIAAGVDRAARALEARGARVEETRLPHSAYAIPVYCIVAMSEASSNLARFDGVRYGIRLDPGSDFEAMLRATRGGGFGAEVKRRIVLGTFALSAGYRDAFYVKAQKARTLIRRDFLEVFRSGIDLLLAPTTPTGPFRLGEKVDDPLAMYLSDVFTASANLAGLPALSLPVGRSSLGLPIGVQLVGPDLDEPTVFAAAAAVESACGRLGDPLDGLRP